MCGTNEAGGIERTLGDTRFSISDRYHLPRYEPETGRIQDEFMNISMDRFTNMLFVNG